MSYKHTMALMLLLFSAKYCCGSLSNEIFRRTIKSATGNENLVTKCLLSSLSKFPRTMSQRGGLVQQSKRSIYSYDIENSDKQGVPIAHGRDNSGLEEYIQRFVWAIFPELNGEEDDWIVQQIAKDVIKEMKMLKEEEWKIMASNSNPSHQRNN